MISFINFFDNSKKMNYSLNNEKSINFLEPELDIESQKINSQTTSFNIFDVSREMDFSLNNDKAINLLPSGLFDDIEINSDKNIFYFSQNKENIDDIESQKFNSSRIVHDFDYTSHENNEQLMNLLPKGLFDDIDKSNSNTKFDIFNVSLEFDLLIYKKFIFSNVFTPLQSMPKI
jgi:hypothetical protein